jgi:hypothetical protein
VTTTANPGLAHAEDLFRDLVWENAIQAGLAALFVEEPALAIWPLKQLIQQVVGMLQTRVYSSLRLAVDLQAIAFVNAKGQREFDAAAVTLKILERDFGPDSQQYKEARENAKAALSRFLRYRGA